MSYFPILDLFNYFKNIKFISFAFFLYFHFDRN